MTFKAKIDLDAGDALRTWN